MSRGITDPERMRQEIEKKMQETHKSPPASLNEVLSKLAAKIRGDNRGEHAASAGLENVHKTQDNYFFFYQTATVVRLPRSTDPKPDFVLRIAHAAPQTGVAARATDYGLQDGFYIMDDGSVVIRVPEDGSVIECFVEGDKGTIADDGFNYKC